MNNMNNIESILAAMVEDDKLTIDGMKEVYDKALKNTIEEFNDKFKAANEAKVKRIKDKEEAKVKDANKVEARLKFINALNEYAKALNIDIDDKSIQNIEKIMIAIENEDYSELFKNYMDIMNIDKLFKTWSI